MKSNANRDFWKCFDKLPQEVQKTARRGYRVWKENPRHPSLVFSPAHPSAPIYSARVGRRYRALGVMGENTMTWIWIGSHEDYNIVINNRDNSWTV